MLEFRQRQTRHISQRMIGAMPMAIPCRLDLVSRPHCSQSSTRLLVGGYLGNIREIFGNCVLTLDGEPSALTLGMRIGSNVRKSPRSNVRTGTVSLCFFIEF